MGGTLHASFDPPSPKRSAKKKKHDSDSEDEAFSSDGAADVDEVVEFERLKRKHDGSLRTYDQLIQEALASCDDDSGSDGELDADTDDESAGASSHHDDSPLEEASGRDDARLRRLAERVHRRRKTREATYYTGPMLLEEEEDAYDDVW